MAKVILDGKDAVMLSGECAKGEYPLEAMTIMAAICQCTDRMRPTRIDSLNDSCKLYITEAVCRAAVETAKNSNRR